MSSIGRIIRAGAAVAVAAALAAPGTARAQTSNIFCNSLNQVCAGTTLNLLSGGTQLELILRNFGTTPAVDSYLSGFGFYDLPTGVTSTGLASATYIGVNPAQTVDIMNLVTFGAPEDLQQGAGTQALTFGVDFGNNGLTTCGDQQISAGGHALRDVPERVRAVRVQPLGGAHVDAARRYRLRVPDAGHRPERPVRQVLLDG
jgi:hypothetical protein